EIPDGGVDLRHRDAKLCHTAILARFRSRGEKCSASSHSAVVHNQPGCPQFAVVHPKPSESATTVEPGVPQGDADTSRPCLTNSCARCCEAGAHVAFQLLSDEQWACGLAWRDVPAEFGKWQTIWTWHRRMSAEGTWDV